MALVITVICMLVVHLILPKLYWPKTKRPGASASIRGMVAVGRVLEARGIFRKN
jgi:hypothetical protein